MKGSLPWQNIKTVNKKEKYKKIKQRKLGISVEKLCEYLPIEFQIYLKYCRNLKFTEKPDYEYLKNIFKDLFINKGYLHDSVFDWTESFGNPIKVYL